MLLINDFDCVSSSVSSYNTDSNVVHTPLRRKFCDLPSADSLVGTVKIQTIVYYKLDLILESMSDQDVKLKLNPKKFKPAKAHTDYDEGWV
jgi:hypothetical protein